MTHDEYIAFLKSPEWRTIRHAAIGRAKGRCERCFLPGRLQVHHLTYARIGGDELPEDLQALCGPCHQNRHGIKGPGTSKSAVRKRKRLAMKQDGLRTELIVQALERCPSGPPLTQAEIWKAARLAAKR